MFINHNNFNLIRCPKINFRLNCWTKPTSGFTSSLSLCSADKKLKSHTHTTIVVYTTNDAQRQAFQMLFRALRLCLKNRKVSFDLNHPTLHKRLHSPNQTSTSTRKIPCTLPRTVRDYFRVFYLNKLIEICL